MVTFVEYNIGKFEKKNINVMFTEKDTNLLDMGNGKITLQHMIGLPSNTFSSSSDN